MIFFGVYFLLAPTPDKTIFANYLRSRRIMGCALLLLAANYAVHFFFEIRLRDVHAAILMNLSTCFLCYWLFSSALTTLPEEEIPADHASACRKKMERITVTAPLPKNALFYKLLHSCIK